MKKLICALIFAMPMLVFAKPPGSGESNGNGCVENCGHKGKGGSGGAGGNGGGGGSGGSGGSGGLAQNASTQEQYADNNQSNYQGLEVSYPNKVRSAPDVFLGSPASGPCNGFSGGISGAGMGFGFAVNSSVVDTSCVERETARVAYSVGRADIANAVLENMEVVKKALAAKNKTAEVTKSEKLVQFNDGENR